MTSNSIIDLITAMWLGFTGACIGSFLNVVAYRMPRGVSVVWKPSHCPRCKMPIRPQDNIPVLSWILLRGRCRDCSGAISPRYAIVEAIMGVTFFLLAYVELFSGGANLPGGPYTQLTGALNVVWNPQWSVIGLYLYHCVVLIVLLVLALVDYDGFRASWKLIAFAVVVGVAVPIVLGWFQSEQPVPNPFLLRSSATVSTYLLHVVASVLFAAMFTLIVALFAGLQPEKAFNLLAALSISACYSGTDVSFRAILFAVFIVIVAISTTERLLGSNLVQSLPGAVWLAQIVVLLCLHPYL